jgi:hypothetical protein
LSRDAGNGDGTMRAYAVETVLDEIGVNATCRRTPERLAERQDQRLGS